MKWRIELGGQGHYWWKAETPLGPVYAEFREYGRLGWWAYWHPYDVDNETTISDGWDTEGEAKDAAEKWIRARVRKVAKKLARFAK